MKKVNYLIVAAGLFISGVMIFLMFQGVHLRERRMVKWSEVESATEAGQKIGQFFFPISKKYELIELRGSGLFTNDFFAAFKTEVESNSSESKIQLNPVKNFPAKFVLNIQELNQLKDLKNLCKAGDLTSCVGVKSRKKFDKKVRASNKTWINIYRTDETNAVLFFKLKDYD